MQPYLTGSKNLVMIGFVAPDRGQTNRQTDTLITILGHPYRARSYNQCANRFHIHTLNCESK